MNVDVKVSYDFRSKWRLHFPLFQGNPVDLVVKERVDEDRLLASIRHHTPQPLRWLLRHKLSQKNNHKLARKQRRGKKTFLLFFKLHVVHSEKNSIILINTTMSTNSCFISSSGGQNRLFCFREKW